MKKVMLEATSEMQMQHWVEKLKEAGITYELTSKSGKTVLVLSEADSLQVLGRDVTIRNQHITEKSKTIGGLVGFAVLVGLAWGGMSLLCNSCESTEPATPKVMNHRDSIEIQFNLWNGSHVNLVKAVKPSLHDPNSFEHLETTWWDQKDKVLLEMKFTATNLMGGRVQHTVVGVADMNGNIISVNSK